jgi:hypothetical protein
LLQSLSLLTRGSGGLGAGAGSSSLSLSGSLGFSLQTGGLLNLQTFLLGTDGGLGSLGLSLQALLLSGSLSLGLGLGLGGSSGFSVSLSLSFSLGLQSLLNVNDHVFLLDSGHLGWSGSTLLGLRNVLDHN